MEILNILVLVVLVLLIFLLSIYGEEVVKNPNEVFKKIKISLGILKDCEVSDWSEWGKCESSKQKRTRIVITEPLGDGNQCPVLEEEQDCIENKNCEVSDWTEWGKCESGKQKRTRIVITEPLGDGNQCPVLEEEQECDEKVTFYEHCNFIGYSFSLGIGEYNNSDIPDNIISSIKIPSSLKVTLYEHQDFNGRSLSLTEDVSCLVNLNFNDLTSSVKIEKQ